MPPNTFGEHHFSLTWYTFEQRLIPTSVTQTLHGRITGTEVRAWMVQFFARGLHLGAAQQHAVALHLLAITLAGQVDVRGSQARTPSCGTDIESSSIHTVSGRSGSEAERARRRTH